MSAEERFAEPTKLAATALNRLPLTFRIRAVLNSFLGTDFDNLVVAIADTKAEYEAIDERMGRQMNPTPRLAKGHVMPSKPAHWAIQIRDADTGELKVTRCAWDKTPDPQRACQQAFGMRATANMTFFVLGTSLAAARKMLRTLPD